MTDPALLARTDLRLAARAWKERAATEPNGTLASIRAARLWLEAGRLAPAVAVRDALRSRPLEPAATVAFTALHALVLSHTGEADAGWREAQSACALAPDDPELRLDAAACALAAGRHSEAEALLAPALPRDLAGRHSVLTALLRLAKGQAGGAVVPLRSAIGAARAANDRVSETSLTGLLGRALVDLRDYGRARPILEATVRLAAATGQARVAAAALGGLGLCRLGDPRSSASWAEASTFLRRAVADCAQHGDPAAESAWRAHLDEVLVGMGRNDERIRELPRWIAVLERLGHLERAGAARQELAAISVTAPLPPHAPR